jgi:serine/threonine protein kinase
VPPSVVQPLRRWDPERIGPYSIIGKLGAGAMGQVFLARSTAGRLVAVKTIRVELAEEPGYRARFAREVAAASRVSGVFTAAVIQADAEADLPWVATAYVPAPSLATLVRRVGPLPVPAVRWLAAGCAEALQSIHGVGLLHRDVKPSNVLVAPTGPQVIDFGVARVAERVQLTATRGSAGTPAYMAPEQARDATLVSSASDIFSLGATLVFAATGHPPYQGETAMDILVRLATEPPDLTGLPGELTDLVSACLERVPRDRPTEAAILADLGSFTFPAGDGHSYLPDSAMALIGEYVSHPRFPAEATTGGGGEDRDEDSAGGGTDGSAFLESSDPTSGSHTALPGFESPSALHAEPTPTPRRSRRRTRPGPRGSARAAPPGRPLLWTAAAVAAAALVAAGIGAGFLLRGSAAGRPPPLAGAPDCTTAAGGTPQICLSQPFGDGDTVYVIQGDGYAPFQPVTVKLTGPGVSAVSPDQPLADKRGAFNYAIDQGHYFLGRRRQIPPGTYNVLVTAPGRGGVSISFTVYTAPAEPTISIGPPPNGPPSGGPPPGAGAPLTPWSTTGPPAASTTPDRLAAAGPRPRRRRARSAPAPRPRPTAGRRPRPARAR